MNTFYVIQMRDGSYVQFSDPLGMEPFEYTNSLYTAGYFKSEEEAIERAPSDQPFTIIKFYDK